MLIKLHLVCKLKSAQIACKLVLLLHMSEVIIEPSDNILAVRAGTVYFYVGFMC